MVGQVFVVRNSGSWLSIFSFFSSPTSSSISFIFMVKLYKSHIGILRDKLDEEKWVQS